jgi:membrane protease subunit (stomatin/prohibitin family)
MAWFGQGKDTVEWEEFRDDVLFYKWQAKEIKKGSRLIIRPGQKAIFYANGKIEGVFEEPGNYDIASEIVPFLSTLKGIFTLRGDTGMRAEVYFVNGKQLLLKWGTRQRIMIPTPEVPSGIPIGCNGNMVIEFRDYKTFIDNVAGVKETYALSDISERIMGEISPILAEAIMEGQQNIGMNALITLQQNSRKLGKTICKELDNELAEFGLGVKDVNIMSINYPEDVQKMAERVAGQSFVGNVGKYAAVQMADSFTTPDANSGVAGAATQMAMGMQLAQQMAGQMNTTQPAPNQGAPTQDSQADRFCTKCRKMVKGKFCSDCGTPTV